MSGKQKKRVNVSLDPELYRRAKMLGLNVSGVSERALREYVDRLENGSRQSGVLVGSSATDKLRDTVNNTDTNDDTQAAYADASIDEILDDHRQFATGVLDRSNTVDLHTRYIERLLEYADTPPSRITQDDITDYPDFESEVSDPTRINSTGSLRVFAATSSVET